VKKRDDLNDVIREERSRGKKRPIDTDAINEQAERRDAVLHNEGSQRGHILKWGEFLDIEMYGMVASDVESVLHTG